MHAVHPDQKKFRAQCLKSLCFQLNTLRHRFQLDRLRGDKILLQISASCDRVKPILLKCVMLKYVTGDFLLLHETRHMIKP